MLPSDRSYLTTVIDKFRGKINRLKIKNKAKSFSIKINNFLEERLFVRYLNIKPIVS